MPLKLSKNVHTASKPATDNQYADIIKNGAKQGQRNHTTARYIGHLFGKGSYETVVWAMIKSWTAAKNTPPLARIVKHGAEKIAARAHSILDRILSRIDAGMETDLNTMLVDYAGTEFERDIPVGA